MGILGECTIPNKLIATGIYTVPVCQKIISLQWLTEPRRFTQATCNYIVATTSFVPGNITALFNNDTFSQVQFV